MSTETTALEQTYTAEQARLDKLGIDRTHPHYEQLLYVDEATELMREAIVDYVDLIRCAKGHAKDETAAVAEVTRLSEVLALVENVGHQLEWQPELDRMRAEREGSDAA